MGSYGAMMLASALVEEIPVSSKESRQAVPELKILRKKMEQGNAIRVSPEDASAIKKLVEQFRPVKLNIFQSIAYSCCPCKSKRQRLLSKIQDRFDESADIRSLLAVKTNLNVLLSALLTTQ